MWEELQKGFEDALEFSVSQMYPEIDFNKHHFDQFIPVELTLNFRRLRPTHITALYVSSSDICENRGCGWSLDGKVYVGLPLMCTKHKNCIDLDLHLPAVGPCCHGQMTLWYWIRPPVNATKVNFMLITDNFVPSTYNLHLQRPNP